MSTTPAPALVMIDGRVVPTAQACVSVFDRGFLYGDAVFETLRTYRGVPFALDAHMDRLVRSASRVLISLPVALGTIRDEVLQGVRQAGYAEAFVRIMLTRGVGEIDLSPQPEARPLRVMIVGPVRPPAPEAYALGVGVVTYRTQRAADATDAVGAKITNYLVSVLAMSEARAVGAVEALIVDRDGCVVEGATSNVFAVIGSELVTPPEESGILLGITRSTVLSVARAVGLQVVLRSVPVEELREADEVFISSSIRELLPVVRIDGNLVGKGRPGPTTVRLHRAYQEKVKEDVGL